MRRGALCAVVLGAALARAHDVSVDLGASATAASADNPRSGSVGAGAIGTWDVTESASAWVGLAYTRDLATRTPEAVSPGSNVFLLSAGGMLLLGEHFSAMLLAAFSPPATQLSATTVTLQLPARRVTADLLLKSVTHSVGGTLVGSYATLGASRLESTADATLSFTRYDTFQQLQLPDTSSAAQLKSACVANPGVRSCALINGARTPLWQVRLGAAYTATLFDAADLTLDASYFLYDQDPTSVGFFTVLALGRAADLGGGVPVAPWLFTARPAFTWRWARVSLRAWYQLGVYVGGLGQNHALGLKATVKVTPALRLGLSVTVQGDAEGGPLVNRGASALLVALYEF